MSNDNLLEITSVTQNFTKQDGKTQKILDKITFNLQEGEILAIVGRSGSGKSTLLKIISKLLEPSSGKVKFNDVVNPVKIGIKSSLSNIKSFGISMVFQNFALFPWLTVLENVELGLEALNLPKDQIRSRALNAIDLIGLDGFESAMPRELSGGMEQRVGFARALVVEPKILLMDEPFSALDVLTSDALKSDFLHLWADKKTPLKSVIIVTHSIEEAVLMADRVLVFASNPGRIASEVRIMLDRPRNPQSEEFRTVVDKIYSQLASASTAIAMSNKKDVKEQDIIHNLPLILPNQIIAITEALASPQYNDSGDLADLVKTLHIKTFDALHIAEALSIVKFATVIGGNVKLTKTGKIFAKASLDERKKIFAKQFLQHVPLATYIVNILHERPDNKAPKSRFQTHLEDHLPHEDAMLALKNIILLGRYAEIFSYDDNKQMFSLDNPE